MTAMTENGQEIKKRGKACMEEINEILNKYNCELICIPQKIYGQNVWMPVVEEKRDELTHKNLNI